MREDLSVGVSHQSVLKRKPVPHLDSGVGAGSPKENASKQKARASVLIQIGTERALGAMRRFA
jgi:hypothetical protein